MKRELSKKSLILGLILLIVFINLTLISAATPKEWVDNQVSKISDSASFSLENFRLYSAQFLFLILVTLIIYVISDSIPFFEDANDGIKILISFVIGILSVMYLGKEEIYTQLMNYEALGIALTTIIPLMILCAITIKWDVKHPEYSWLPTILWVSYFVAFLIKYSQSLYSLYATASFSADPNHIGAFGIFFIAITAIVSLLMLFLGGKISRMIFLRRLKGLITKGELNTEAEITGRINQLRQYIIATPELASDYESIISQLEKARKRIKREEGMLS